MTARARRRRRAAHAAAPLLLLLAHSPLARAPARALELGVLGPLGSAGRGPLLGYALLGGAHANARNGSVVAALGDLGNCSTVLNVTLVDTGGDCAAALDAALGPSAPRARRWDALLGPGVAACALPLASASAALGVPLVAYAASPDALADARLFPLVARLHPSAATLAAGVGRWVATHGWRALALLLPAQHGLGAEVGLALSALLGARGVDVAVASYDPADNATIGAALDALLASGAPARVLCAPLPSDGALPNLVAAAAARGLIGEASRHWVFVDASSAGAEQHVPPPAADDAAPDDWRRHLDGSVVIGAGARPGGARWRAARAALASELTWGGVRAALAGGNGAHGAYAGELDALRAYPDDADLAAAAARGELPWTAAAAARAATAPPGGALAYDAVAALALGACAVEAAGGAAPGEAGYAVALHAALGALAFAGASGHVAFTHAGERLGGGAEGEGGAEGGGAERLLVLQRLTYDAAERSLTQRALDATPLDDDAGGVGTWALPSAYAWFGGGAHAPADGVPAAAPPPAGARAGEAEAEEGGGGGEGEHSHGPDAAGGPPSSELALYQALLFAAASVAALLCATLCAGATVRSRRRWAALEASRRKYEARELDAATECNQRLQFWLTLSSYAQLRAHDGLRPYEALRAEGAHTTLDTIEACAAFLASKHFVFVSHQWLAQDHPDPTAVQYRAMMHAVRAIGRHNGWPLEDVHVWVDYCSVPQLNPTQMGLAIDNLALYASMASAFLIVAPDATHATTGAPCGAASFHRRMWCRAEQLCYAMRNGHTNMWIATSEVEPPEPVGAEWLLVSVRVFEGEATCCSLCHVFDGCQRNYCDRHKLVRPILGLYGELYREQLLREMQSRQLQSEMQSRSHAESEPGGGQGGQGGALAEQRAAGPARRLGAGSRPPSGCALLTELSASLGARLGAQRQPSFGSDASSRGAERSGSRSRSGHHHPRGAQPRARAAPAAGSAIGPAAEVADGPPSAPRSRRSSRAADPAGGSSGVSSLTSSWRAAAAARGAAAAEPGGGGACAAAAAAPPRAYGRLDALDFCAATHGGDAFAKGCAAAAGGGAGGGGCGAGSPSFRRQQPAAAAGGGGGGARRGGGAAELSDVAEGGGASAAAGAAARGRRGSGTGSLRSRFARAAPRPSSGGATVAARLARARLRSAPVHPAAGRPPPLFAAASAGGGAAEQHSGRGGRGADADACSASAAAPPPHAAASELAEARFSAAIVRAALLPEIAFRTPEGEQLVELFGNLPQRMEERQAARLALELPEGGAMESAALGAGGGGSGGGAKADAAAVLGAQAHRAGEGPHRWRDGRGLALPQLLPGLREARRALAAAATPSARTSVATASEPHAAQPPSGGGSGAEGGDSSAAAGLMPYALGATAGLALSLLGGAVGGADADRPDLPDFSELPQLRPSVAAAEAAETLRAAVPTTPPELLPPTPSHGVRTAPIGRRHPDAAAPRSEPGGGPCGGSRTPTGGGTPGRWRRRRAFTLEWEGPPPIARLGPAPAQQREGDSSAEARPAGVGLGGGTPQRRRGTCERLRVDLDELERGSPHPHPRVRGRSADDGGGLGGGLGLGSWGTPGAGRRRSLGLGAPRAPGAGAAEPRADGSGPASSSLPSSRRPSTGVVE